MPPPASVSGQVALIIITESCPEAAFPCHQVVNVAPAAVRDSAIYDTEWKPEKARDKKDNAAKEKSGKTRSWITTWDWSRRGYCVEFVFSAVCRSAGWAQMEGHHSVLLPGGDGLPLAQPGVNKLNHLQGRIPTVVMTTRERHGDSQEQPFWSASWPSAACFLGQ